MDWGIKREEAKDESQTFDLSNRKDELPLVLQVEQIWGKSGGQNFSLICPFSAPFPMT